MGNRSNEAERRIKYEITRTNKVMDEKIIIEILKNKVEVIRKSLKEEYVKLTWRTFKERIKRAEK